MDPTYYSEEDKAKFPKEWFGQAGWEMKQREGGMTLMPAPDSDLYWEFDMQQGELIVNVPGEVEPRRWRGRSGSSNYEPLPSGNYTILEGMNEKEPTDAPFRDPKGNCWSKPIIPDFKTHRNNLAIHPDGNLPGTAGCLGLTEEDTSEVYSIFKKHPTGKLIVK